MQAGQHPFEKVLTSLGCVRSGELDHVSVEGSDLATFTSEVVIWDNVVVFVAEVDDFIPSAATEASIVSFESIVLISLGHLAIGTADVFQLVIDIESDFRKPDNHREYGNRRNQHQLSRDNKTSFVTIESVDQERHLRDLSGDICR